MQEQEQNRNEPATPHKLSEARKRGQVAKSLDFNSLVIVCGLLASLIMFGATAWERLLALCSRLFMEAGALQLDRWSYGGGLAEVGLEALSLFAPFALVGVLFGILGNLIQTGPIFSGHPLKPQFERLNPIAGFKRVYNKRMLFEALKSVLKLIFLLCIAYGFFAALWPELSVVSTADIGALLSWLQKNGTALLFRLCMALLAIAMLDLFFVRWQFRKQMMMSRRELKEEVKRREGDPLIRAKIRELQQENLKQSKSLRRVQDADLLVTNPTHFAVALRYVRGEMQAPSMIARGRDAWVSEMKSLARKHGIPIYERPALARKLFRIGDLDRAVPPDTFVDVARLYADLEAQRRSDERYQVLA